jgi:hypothetical protein
LRFYLSKEELEAVCKAAARSGRSTAEIIRDAIRIVVIGQEAAGPVAIRDGEPRHFSIDHDSIYDEP